MKYLSFRQSLVLVGVFLINIERDNWIGILTLLVDLMRGGRLDDDLSTVSVCAMEAGDFSVILSIPRVCFIYIYIYILIYNTYYIYISVAFYNLPCKDIFLLSIQLILRSSLVIFNSTH